MKPHLEDVLKEGTLDDQEDVSMNPLLANLKSDLESAKGTSELNPEIKTSGASAGLDIEVDELEDAKDNVTINPLHEEIDDDLTDVESVSSNTSSQQSSSSTSSLQSMRDALFDKSQKPVQVNKIPDFFRHEDNFKSAIEAGKELDEKGAEKGPVKSSIDLSSWRTEHGATNNPNYQIVAGTENELGVYYIQAPAMRFKVDFSKGEGGPEIIEERLMDKGQNIANTADGKAANFGYRAERLGMLATAFEGEFEKRGIDVVKESKGVEKVADVAVEEVKEEPKTLKDTILDLDSLIKNLEENSKKLAAGSDIQPIEIGKKKEPVSQINDQSLDSSNPNPVIVEAPAGKDKKQSGSMLGSIMKFLGFGAKEEEKQEDPQIKALQDLMEKWAEAANAKLPEGLDPAEELEAKAVKIAEMKGMVAEIAKERTSAALKNLESEGKIKDGEEKDGVKPKNIEFENPDAAKQFCENYQKACEGLGIECKMTQKEGGGYKLSTPKECAGKDIFNMSEKDLLDLKGLINANKEAAKEAADVKAAAEAGKVTVDMGHDEDDLHEEPEKKIEQTENLEEDLENNKEELLDPTISKVIKVVDEEEQDLEEQKEETQQEKAQRLAHELVSNGSIDLKELVGDSSVSASSLAGQQHKEDELGK